MACKAVLGKCGGKGRPDEKDNSALDTTRASDHLEKFSTVRAVVTHSSSAGVEVL